MDFTKGIVMSFMETVKGFVGSHSEIKNVADGLQSFVQKNGGFDGLKAKFEKEGAGSIVQSWISTGPNLPITGEHLQKIMGNEFVQDVAKKMGVDPATASQKLAQFLPNVIDKLSPNGKLPENLDSKNIADAAAQLTKKT